MLMRLLELFRGTGSVGKVAKDMGYDVISVDRDMKATHQCDIMQWDYQAAFPQDYFQFVWASPDCTMFSIARTRGGASGYCGSNSFG